MTPVYATAEDLAAYAIEDELPEAKIPTGDAADCLLERAERDVDRAIGGPPHPDRRRRLDPGTLTDPQREALTRATCAQASFLIAQRPRTLVGQDDRVAVAGPLTFADRAFPRLGARVLEELAGYGLLADSRTVPAVVIDSESEDAA